MAERHPQELLRAPTANEKKDVDDALTGWGKSAPATEQEVGANAQIFVAAAVRYRNHGASPIATSDSDQQRQRGLPHDDHVRYRQDSASQNRFQAKRVCPNTSPQKLSLKSRAKCSNCSVTRKGVILLFT